MFSRIRYEYSSRCFCPSSLVPRRSCPEAPRSRIYLLSTSICTVSPLAGCQAPASANAQAAVKPNRQTSLTLNRSGIASLLAIAPNEHSQAAKRSALVLSLPDPCGQFERFTVDESRTPSASRSGTATSSCTRQTGPAARRRSRHSAAGTWSSTSDLLPDGAWQPTSSQAGNLSDAAQAPHRHSERAPALSDEE